MDLWSDDYELPPAPAPRGRRRDPRTLVLAAIVAAIVLIGAITVVVSNRDRPEQVAAADERGADRERSPGERPATSTTADATTTTDRAAGTSSPTSPPTTRATTPPTTRPDDGTMARFTVRAVSPDGAPIPGLFVYVGDTLERNLRTDHAGEVSLDCVAGGADHEADPVLLSGVQINYMFGEHSQDQNWAPTPVEETLDGIVGDACGGEDPIMVSMQPGATLHVSFSDPTERQREYYESSFIRVPVSLDGHDLPIAGRPQCVPICYEVEGSGGPPWTDVTIVGLPAGEALAWIFPDDPCTAVLVPVQLEAGNTAELASVLPDGDGNCSSNDPPPPG